MHEWSLSWSDYKINKQASLAGFIMAIRRRWKVSVSNVSRYLFDHTWAEKTCACARQKMKTMEGRGLTSGLEGEAVRFSVSRAGATRQETDSRALLISPKRMRCRVIHLRYKHRSHIALLGVWPSRSFLILFLIMWPNEVGKSSRECRAVLFLFPSKLSCWSCCVGNKVVGHNIVLYMLHYIK